MIVYVGHRLLSGGNIVVVDSESNDVIGGLIERTKTVTGELDSNYVTRIFTRTKWNIETGPEDKEDKKVKGF